MQCNNTTAILTQHQIKTNTDMTLQLKPQNGENVECYKVRSSIVLRNIFIHIYLLVWYLIVSIYFQTKMCCCSYNCSINLSDDTLLAY